MDPSSSLAPATFQQKEGASPANLRSFLRECLDPKSGRSLFQGPEARDWWGRLLPHLAYTLFDSIRAPDELPWVSMHEPRVLAEDTLGIMAAAMDKLPVILVSMNQRSLAPALFTGLLHMASVLDLWVDAAPPPEEGYTGPQELLDKVVDVSVKVLKTLGNFVVVPENGPSPREILADILRRGVEVAHELLSYAQTSEFPITIKVYERAALDEELVSEGALSIRILDGSYIPTLLAVLLEIMMTAVSPPTALQWFLADVLRDYGQLLGRTQDFLFFSCHTTSVRRMRALTRFCIALSNASVAADGFNAIAESCWTRLLLYRIQTGPDVEWEGAENTLARALETSVMAPRNQADFHAILVGLQTEGWEEAGDGLRRSCYAYLTLYIPFLDSNSLRLVRETSGLVPTTECNAFMSAIDSRLHVLDHPNTELDAPSRAQSWRHSVREAVQTIIEPRELDWMDDDEDTDDSQFVSRALEEVRSRFLDQPIYNPAASARVALAKELGKFACLLGHAEAAECLPSSDRPDMSLVPTILEVVLVLLDGREAGADAAVRASVSAALAKALRHDTAGVDDRLFEHVLVVVTRGMKDKQRSARLAAGRALVDLVQFSQRQGLPEEYETQIFQKLTPLLTRAESPIRETTLLAVGLVGKVAQGDVLRECICNLVYQMGDGNALIRGVASLQLLNIARHVRRTPYLLTWPYSDHISNFVVERMCVNQDLLVEYCRFLSISPYQFLKTTLSFTLPNLFVKGNLKVLNAVGTEVGLNVARLTILNAQYILARAFSLQRPGDTRRVLDFILSATHSTGGDGARTIDILNLMISCRDTLLVELVINCGDADPDNVAGAVNGLHKVAQFMGLEGHEKPRTPDEQRTFTSNFLQDRMLGVISALNDMLQDVAGKQTIQSKQKILRGFGAFFKLVGPEIYNVAPQIMATFQTMLVSPGLAETTLQSWLAFLSELKDADLGPQVGPSTASFITAWPSLSAPAREWVRKCLETLIVTRGRALGSYVSEIVDLDGIPELNAVRERLSRLRATWTPMETCTSMLERLVSENVTVAIQAATELRVFLLSHDEKFIRTLTSGDTFDPVVGPLVSSLYVAACRDGEGCEVLRGLVFDCIGIVGAIDPDRFDLPPPDRRVTMLHNFADQEESVGFALHLIKDVLVGAFRSTSDLRYQAHLAYAVQHLLRFCGFTSDLLKPATLPSQIRRRWKNLPKHVLETVTPLLGANFNAVIRPFRPASYPIYPSYPTYREWIQSWASDLVMNKVSGETAQSIFRVFGLAVTNKDVGVAHHLLPHLVLNVLVTGDQAHSEAIRDEILAVLKDQIAPHSPSSPDKKLLSAQTVFMLLDHLNRWIRSIGEDIRQKEKAHITTGREHPAVTLEKQQLAQVNSILSTVDQNLMAKAAFQCKAYARSLMNFEQQIASQRARGVKDSDLQERFERIHEIYAHLDEPDAMEGVSTLILSPSMEHQIRQHESSGKWTSAQSCWEVRLQHSPNNLDYHLGLLRCLRNLGHYDSLRTHVSGVLTRNPDWQPRLKAFQIESEWLVGHWDAVRQLATCDASGNSPVLLAQVLLAMRANDTVAIGDALSAARQSIGSSIVAAGPSGYRRSYDAVLELHLVHELEVIHNTLRALPAQPPPGTPRMDEKFAALLRRLEARFESTLPTFRIQEAVLNMRRTALNLGVSVLADVKDATGEAWLNSAKIARKAGHAQTAYSAILQAQRCNAPYSFIQSVKLVRRNGDPTRALQELESAMQQAGILKPLPRDHIDLSGDEKMKAKACILHARWMHETGRYNDSALLKEFIRAVDGMPSWESAHFHVGQYQDDCYKALSEDDKKGRGMRMNYQTVRHFVQALKFGSKYTYQTVPRILTIWLDMADDTVRLLGDFKDSFSRTTKEIAAAMHAVPVYKWYTAFSQMLSRLGVKQSSALNVLESLVVKIMREYPKQALWLFLGVALSTNKKRQEQAASILDKVEAAGGDVMESVLAMLNIGEPLAQFCSLVLPYEANRVKIIYFLSQQSPKLYATSSPHILIPVQTSLTAIMPSASTANSEAAHQPFALDLPTLHSFPNEMDVMNSLQKPKKIRMVGSNGQTYIFLAKGDDLRKDARLMDFNAMLAKTLRSNSESRRRQLHIRTYAAISCRETCGIIEWVPNTSAVRGILSDLYMRRDGTSLQLPPEMLAVGARIQTLFEQGKVQDAIKMYKNRFDSKYPAVFHEWFIETFPEPSAWLSSRIAYTRTTAVMSMVGYILGLGDRHSDNILMDCNNGDLVHVDFDCLFLKGQTLPVIELAPFRLTKNVVDGFGLTGVEGVFRITCEVTLQLLMSNKDMLLNVLEAFINDPLADFTSQMGRCKVQIAGQTLRGYLLSPVEHKLSGYYKAKVFQTDMGKLMNVPTHVQNLIQFATDINTMARMYIGWAAYI